MRVLPIVLLCLGVLCCANVAEGSRKKLGKVAIKPDGPNRDDDGPSLSPTVSGYLSVNSLASSEMFFVFYEAKEPKTRMEDTPILLWLQGGPGCSSLFGMLYINGPFFIHPNLTLYENPGTWTKHYAMLFIDQPVGTGFSHPGFGAIPGGETDLAADLYAAIQKFFTSFPRYSTRPFFVTGESYAGKYVPSISHYIIEADLQAQNRTSELRHPRHIGANIPPPAFNFRGLAIGNGFTDAVTQTRVQAEVAWAMGLIDWEQRKVAEALQERVVEAILAEDLGGARKLSDQLMAYITNTSASACLEDVRRNRGYDQDDLVSKYLNLPHVKRHLKARESINYEVCSKEVDAAMGHDIMRSVAKLVPDILDHSHLLIYLGQFDAECGVASNDAWLGQLKWPGHPGFAAAERKVWWREGVPAGYHKHFGPLSQIIVRNAGHMVPHDQPFVAREMIEGWVEGVLASGSRGLLDQPAAAAAAAAAVPEEAAAESASAAPHTAAAVPKAAAAAV